MEAAQSLDNMVEDMENDYKEKIEILHLQVEDACRLVERYIVENEKLANHIDTMKDALDKHTEWSKLSMAIYVLVFVYGLVYGAYFKSHEQEL
jgi:hypothetical protein